MQLQSPKTEMELINQAWFSQPHLKRLHQSLLTAVKSVHQRGVDIVKQLPESIQPLAHEVYTMNAEWLELSDSEIARLFAESREQLELVWTKQRLVEISKQMAEMTPKTEAAEALQEEYRQLAAMNKRAETGRDESASV
jgi:hypothetical protein